jgi:hypothetical protein
MSDETMYRGFRIPDAQARELLEAVRKDEEENR